jgi:hypothetical protein
MISETAIEKALDFMRDNAPNLAKAKSDRVHLEQYRKSKKALLMNEKEGAQHLRESYAYAHPEYEELLEGLREAVRQEEELKWMMEAARMKVDVWRTQSSNARAVDASHK